MAIAIVQQGNNGGLYAANSTAIPVTLPGVPVQPNLLLGFGTGDGVAASSGSAYTSIANKDSAAQAQASYKYALVSDSVTQQFLATNEATSQYAQGLVFELSGVAASAGLHLVSATGTPAYGGVAGANTLATPSITPTANGAVFVELGFESEYNTFTSYTPSAGWSLIGPLRKNNGSGTTNFSSTLFIMYRFDAAAGTAYSGTLTVNTTSGTPSCIAVAIAQATATAYRRRVSSSFMIGY